MRVVRTIGAIFALEEPRSVPVRARRARGAPTVSVEGTWGTKGRRGQGGRLGEWVHRVRLAGAGGLEVERGCLPLSRGAEEVGEVVALDERRGSGSGFGVRDEQRVVIRDGWFAVACGSVE